MTYAPICLFVFKRLEETKQTVASLQANSESRFSDLYIFSDAARNESESSHVSEVRKYIHTISGFKSITIFEVEQNKGLANSIIDGVSSIISKKERVIVLEDDLILSSNFLAYMNQALDFYENNNQIISISGFSYNNIFPINYPYDATFGIRASSWGWATWVDRWIEVDWDVSDYNSFRFNVRKRLKFNKGGSDMSRMLSKQMKQKINSWAIRFCYYQSKYNLYDVIPKTSKVINIGFNNDGEHCRVKGYEDSLDVSGSKIFYFPSQVIVNNTIVKKMRRNHSLYKRLKRFIIKKRL